MDLVKFQNTKSIYKNQLHFYANNELSKRKILKIPFILTTKGMQSKPRKWNIDTLKTITIEENDWEGTNK